MEIDVDFSLNNKALFDSTDTSSGNNDNKNVNKCSKRKYSFNDNIKHYVC